MKAQIENHGTLFLFRPLDPEAEQWLRDHRDPAESQWYGGALVVEHRYIEEIAAGFRSEGGELL